MYKGYQMELQSSEWLQNHNADRPSFESTVSKGFSKQPYQVFLMPQGILFLELRNKAASPNQSSNAMVTGALLGGALGAVIGAAIASSVAPPAEKDKGFELCSDEELFAIARSRKLSFVLEKDDITRVSIDAPGALSRLFGSSAAGWITLDDARLGKVKMEIREQTALSVAVDAFPRRFSDRALVNVRWDDRKMRFLPLRS